MSKLAISITAGEASLGTTPIGSVRTPGTVTLKVASLPEKKQVYSTTLSPATSLSIPGATTAGWTARKNYHCEIWETAGDGTIQAGHFGISVAD
jgi:hypothetical protein